jgi:hypothetical protein
MAFFEKSKITLKLEVSLPSEDGGPSKKFSIDRTLRAKWSTQPPESLQLILDEIKNYKGSFLGDMFFSLMEVVSGEIQLDTPEQRREHEVTRWASHLLESMLVDGLHNGSHDDLLENHELPEWDGTSKKIQPITPQELRNVDADRLVTLLSPRLKHFLYLISKGMEEK